MSAHKQLRQGKQHDHVGQERLLNDRVLEQAQRNYLSPLQLDPKAQNTPRPETILQLQRLHGNVAVSKIISRLTHNKPIANIPFSPHIQRWQDGDKAIVDELINQMTVPTALQVANPLGGKEKSTDYQFNAKKAMGLTGFQEPKRVGREGDFYGTLGSVINVAASSRTPGNPVYLTCLEFNAYISTKLKEMGFKGSIHKGYIGLGTNYGHEFLILYLGTAHEIIVDFWSAAQTGKRPAYCTRDDYRDFLPKTEKDQSLLALFDKNGIQVGIELKPQAN